MIKNESLIENREKRCEELLRVKQQKLKAKREVIETKKKLRKTKRIRLVVYGVLSLIIIILATEWSKIKKTVDNLQNEINTEPTEESIVALKNDLTSDGEYLGTNIKISTNTDDTEKTLRLSINSLSASMYDKYYTFDKELLSKLKEIKTNSESFVYNDELYEISNDLDINTVDCYGSTVLIEYRNSNNTLMREVAMQSSDKTDVLNEDTNFYSVDSETGIKSTLNMNDKVEYKSNYNGLGFILHDAVSTGEIVRDNDSVTLKKLIKGVKLSNNIDKEIFNIDIDGFGTLKINEFNEFKKGTGFCYSKEDNFIKVFNDSTDMTYMYIASLGNKLLGSDYSKYEQISSELLKSNNFENDKTYIIQRNGYSYMVKVNSEQVFNDMVNQLNIDLENNLDSERLESESEVVEN